MNGQLLNFFKEAWNRLSSKSPKFFFIMKVIGASLALAGKIPWALERYTNVNPSDQFVNLCSDIGTFFAGVFATSFLPSSSHAVALTPEGHVIKKTDAEKLPFTTVSEAKKAEKESVPVVENL
jgi:hypothetical protein